MIPQYGRKQRGTRVSIKVKEESEKTGLKINIKKTKTMASGPMTSCKYKGEKWQQWQILFSWAPKSLWTVTGAMKLRHLLLGRKAMTNLQHIQKQRHHFANKGLSSQSFGFFSSHVQMWQLDHKEGWASKNLCFRTVVLEKTLESPWDSKEIKSVNPKGNQPWIFIGRTDTKAEALILWPPDMKSWLFAKDPDAGKNWRQEEKGMTEDEMVGWHHWLSEHEFELTPRESEGQWSLACCNPWGCKDSDKTENLNKSSKSIQIKIRKKKKACVANFRRNKAQTLPLSGVTQGQA